MADTTQTKTKAPQIAAHEYAVEHLLRFPTGRPETRKDDLELAFLAGASYGAAVCQQVTSAAFAKVTG